MTTLVDTLAAVRAVLAPLVTAGTIKVVLDGPQNQMNEFPAAEVRWGPGTVTREPAGQGLERRHIRNGVVRIYVEQTGLLGENYVRLAPVIDAVEAAFRDAPTLSGAADRFDASGNGPLLKDSEVNCLYVDVSWAAMDIEPDTYLQDW